MVGFSLRTVWEGFRNARSHEQEQQARRGQLVSISARDPDSHWPKANPFPRQKKKKNHGQASPATVVKLETAA